MSYVLTSGAMPARPLSLVSRSRPLMTRAPFARMQRIFCAIKQGQYPNRIRLASEIEVTTKTIQRDIDFMRDRFGMPIDYNDQRQGYEFSEPVENFPLLELSEAELVSVFVAQSALVQYKGTPFEQPLRCAFEKLVCGLDGKIAVSWNDLDAFISFRSFEIVPADLATFQVASDAVRLSKVLHFEYKKLQSSKYQPRRVELYHIACIQDQWYCFGHDIDRRAIRTFVLARMRKAELGIDSFQKPASFSIQDYLKTSFGVFTAKGVKNIRIRFDKFAAQLIRERIWHPSQQLQDLAGGEVELQLTVSSLHEIEPWVMSWGAHAQVLDPAELVSRLVKNAQKQLAQYGG